MTNYLIDLGFRQCQICSTQLILILNYHNVNCLVLMFGKCAVNNVTILIHYHQCQAAMWSCLQVLIINQE